MRYLFIPMQAQKITVILISRNFHKIDTPTAITWQTWRIVIFQRQQPNLKHVGWNLDVCAWLDDRWLWQLWHFDIWCLVPSIWYRWRVPMSIKVFDSSSMVLENSHILWYIVVLHITQCQGSWIQIAGPEVVEMGNSHIQSG